MRASPAFVICVLSGIALSVAGWKLAKAQEPKPGNTTFVSFYSPTVLLGLLGWLLFAIGLFLSCILSTMFYIKG